MLWLLLFKRETTRFVCVLTAATLLTLALAWAYQVQRELDIGSTKWATYDVEVPLVSDESDSRDLLSQLGGAAFLASNWAVKMSAGKDAPVSVTAYLTSTSEMERYSPFPVATRTAFARVTGSNWADLSLPAARDLGVGPGDRVAMWLDADRSIPLTVRAVYAVEDSGSADMAIVPWGAVRPQLRAAEIKDGDTALTVGYVADASPARVRSIISRPPLAAAYITAGYDLEDLGIATRLDQLDQAERQSAASTGVILLIAAFSSAALLGMVAREGSVFVRSTGDTARTLALVGVSSRRLARVISGFGFGSLAVGFVLGSLAAYWFFHSGIWMVGFPPTLVVRFIGSTALVLLLAAAVLAAVVRLRLAKSAAWR